MAYVSDERMSVDDRQPSHFILEGASGRRVASAVMPHHRFTFDATPSRFRATLFVTALACALLPASASAQSANPAATYGAAWNPAVGAWLPDPEAGFHAWAAKRAIVIKGYDYFVCGSNAKPALPVHDFHYPGSACAPLKNGTAFVYGTAEPIRGTVVYDGMHGVVLFDKGCCAWRGFELTSTLKAPPKPVKSADLSRVRTTRGVALGMTSKQVAHIYGAAAPHPAKDRAGFTTISYTTMTHGPNDPGGEPCGQFQSFTFANDKLVSIELLTGC